MWSHQNADQLAESDKTFNDLLTAAVDFNNDLRFNNAKAIAGEVAAGGTYKDLIQLDASNVCQLAESGTEVRVPADPSNALGVATKQYVDGVQMFQLQAQVSVSFNNTKTTILNAAATTRGVIHAIWYLMSVVATTVRIQIDIDGTANVVDSTSPAMAEGVYGHLAPNCLAANDNITVDESAGVLVQIPFNSQCQVYATAGGAGASSTCLLRYSKIP